MKTPARPAVRATRIVTLTLNPALDITTSIDRVRPTEKLRCRPARYDPGGGGVNVARIAHVLGAPVLAILAAGGPSGGLVTALLEQARVPFDRVPIAEPTRESFTIDEQSTGGQYRFVLPGARMTFAEQVHCLVQLRAATASAGLVVASGSLPPGVPGNYYQRVADVCRHAGVPLILEQRRAAAVVVSLGAEGALLAAPAGSYRFSAVRMRGGRGVGAGDAMVAAIALGLSRGWPLVKSVQWGIAAGAAMLMTPDTAVCSRSAVENLFALVAQPSEVIGLSA
ncbi:1-phosphofructokinase family hexose kinase [Mycolicibacter hiberniae]|uniref:Phosphofructokinase n=1 Tax=Mycolicibacter hiberniae TaxID=29314 RepID=A0A7I7X2A7_9MYCO|nr:1-phosphofructokinase family hexose kinase [Mycolicibacter hiberniae]MCV7084835.1 1-phosphofructokinase family hexose kinase [Mycolicibacter hiberniae]ORV71471.1 phosphofructokinase [Mycolicibacter hiberniae]BBZ23325.1 phosphofructokinase [Mycolicibacter hiberniae]